MKTLKFSIICVKMKKYVLKNTTEVVFSFVSVCVMLRSVALSCAQLRSVGGIVLTSYGEFE
jgi:hypothetical protein